MVQILGKYHTLRWNNFGDVERLRFGLQHGGSGGLIHHILDWLEQRRCWVFHLLAKIVSKNKDLMKL